MVECIELSLGKLKLIKAFEGALRRLLNPAAVQETRFFDNRPPSPWRRTTKTGLDLRFIALHQQNLSQPVDIDSGITLSLETMAC
ncbi:MAG: hypothetical protein M3R45_04900 [Pseudomonadota bacterium]|nr:hypothetical protein [Pseudomonadota bacterium]